MPIYYVNKKEQENGDHEVHKSTCHKLPGKENQQYLGYFTDCHDAVREAKEYYSQSNGCIHCCPDCHTG